MLIIDMIRLQFVNGIAVISDYMPYAETVAIEVLVQAGSRDESESENGISHFLEHMAFKGTPKRSARQIAEEFDMIGGNFNAYTSRENTAYYAKALKQDLPTVVDVLSDIVQHSLFDENDINQERKVILEELAHTKDEPDDYVFELFQEQLFPKQPIGRSILGTEQFINSVSKNDLTEYVKKMYGKNNVIVACAGNFDHGYFAELVEKNFQHLPDKSARRNLNAQYAGGEKRLQKNLEQVHLSIGFEGASYLDHKHYDQQLLSVILGGGMSSRLFQEVREKRGLAYHVSAFTSHYQDTGAFVIYSATNELSVNELLKVVSEQMKLASQNITDEELQRAKAQVKSACLMAQESSASRVSRIATSYATFNKIVSIEELMAKIDKITVDDLHQCVLDLLKNKKPMTVAAVGKIKGCMTYDQIQQAFAI